MLNLSDPRRLVVDRVNELRRRAYDLDVKFRESDVWRICEVYGLYPGIIHFTEEGVDFQLTGHKRRNRGTSLTGWNTFMPTLRAFYEEREVSYSQFSVDHLSMASEARQAAFTAARLQNSFDDMAVTAPNAMLRGEESRAIIRAT